MTLPAISLIPLMENRFTTLGDWQESSPGRFSITVTDMGNWKYEFLILIHELTEWAICQAMGVSTKSCDDFDSLWETELRNRLQRVETEAGFDHRCPYRRGHVWGARMEWFFCKLLRANWRTYCATCDAKLLEYDREPPRFA